ncbi:hypothetical protein NQ314_011158 [Rhamnusium bicolor]|uniref:Uncharacterized protein n=1 Tax=Rhamnusium bicolor TaxID=1586634 RepID=A0AAV8XKA4_9CUCU|nr:hypothetical protein NQ314_011158 [Rhamnusium bicolor]
MYITHEQNIENDDVIIKDEIEIKFENDNTEELLKGKAQNYNDTHDTFEEPRSEYASIVHVENLIGNDVSSIKEELKCELINENIEELTKDRGLCEEYTDDNFEKTDSTNENNEALVNISNDDIEETEIMRYAENI